MRFLSSRAYFFAPQWNNNISILVSKRVVAQSVRLSAKARAQKKQKKKFSNTRAADARARERAKPKTSASRHYDVGIPHLGIILRRWLVSARRRGGSLYSRRSSGWRDRCRTLELFGEFAKALGLLAAGAGRGFLATSSSAPAPPKPVQSVHRYHCWFLQPDKGKQINLTRRLGYAKRRTHVCGQFFPPRFPLFTIVCLS